MKIFERILDARLRQISTITANQCGFVKGSGTTDAIHAARLLVEKHREKKLTVHMAFLDLEKAFDRVPHDLIWHALRSHGAPESLCQLDQTIIHKHHQRRQVPCEGATLHYQCRCTPRLGTFASSVYTMHGHRDR